MVRIVDRPYLTLAVLYTYNQCFAQEGECQIFFQPLHLEFDKTHWQRGGALRNGYQIRHLIFRIATHD